ncbi:MAG: hypothetical protein JWR84_1823 [Caulobacter sp.]|nr:hypothetical protein [Caulobacter sp.]
MTLEEETERLQALLEGLTVISAARTKPTELVMCLSNQTRLYVNWEPDGTLDLSVEGGNGWQEEA